MGKITCLLVPGAAGPAGINTIKSLKMSGYTGSIIATDSSELAAGYYLSSRHYMLPEVDDRQVYAEKLLELVSRERVQVLMPSSGYDIYAYADLKKELEEKGAQPIVSSRSSLEICRDKLLTYESLIQDHKAVLPFTTSDPSKISSFPVMAKPRYGKGSRDVIRVDDEMDLRYVCSKYQDMIFQEFLTGEEYTVDVLSDLSGHPIAAVPRLRLQTKAGISTQGRIVHNALIESMCKKIAEAIGIIGPCCIQVMRSSAGAMKLVEVNPRMGGGTIFAALAGVNIPKLILDMVEGRQLVVPVSAEITVVRCFDEIVMNGRVFNQSGKGALGPEILTD